MILYGSSSLISFIYLIMTMINISAERIKINIPELPQLLNSICCPKADMIEKRKKTPPKNWIKYVEILHNKSIPNHVNHIKFTQQSRFGMFSSTV